MGPRMSPRTNCGGLSSWYWSLTDTFNCELEPSVANELVELDSVRPLLVMNLCIEMFFVAPIPNSGDIFGLRDIMLATGDVFDCLVIPAFLINEEFLSLFISSSALLSNSTIGLLLLPLLAFPLPFEVMAAFLKEKSIKF